MHVFAESEVLASLSSNAQLKGNDGKASRRLRLRRNLFLTFVTCVILTCLYCIRNGKGFRSEVRHAAKVERVDENIERVDENMVEQYLKDFDIGRSGANLRYSPPKDSPKLQRKLKPQPKLEPPKESEAVAEEKEKEEEGRIIQFYVSNLDSSSPETEGSFTIRTRPSWSPDGARRFEELTEQSFWDGCRFFRAIDKFVVQFGINGHPLVQKKWSGKTLKDEEVKASNKRGTVTFAKSGPNTRETQMYINTGKRNQNLDKEGFSPVAEVIHGMDVVDQIYTGYNGDPVQYKIERQGNVYLNENFPKLSFISKAQFSEQIVGDFRSE